jgi:hypothetical protein
MRGGCGEGSARVSEIASTTQVLRWTPQPSRQDLSLPHAIRSMIAQPMSRSGRDVNTRITLSGGGSGTGRWSRRDSSPRKGDLPDAPAVFGEERFPAGEIEADRDARRQEVTRAYGAGRCDAFEVDVLLMAASGYIGLMVECKVGRTERGKASCSHLAHWRIPTGMDRLPRSVGHNLVARLLLFAPKEHGRRGSNGSPANLLVGGRYLCRREGIEGKGCGGTITLVKRARTRGMGRSSAMESREGRAFGRC